MHMIKHALWLPSNELYVPSLQMSSGSLTARWQTRPSWQTLVWCPCWTLLLVSTGHILWMRRGLLKVQASVKYTEYTGLSLKNTIFTAEYGLDPCSMLCDHKLAARCYGINNYWVFFPQGQHWPFDSMDIFVPDKCSQMPSCLSAFNSTWYFNTHIFLTILSSALPGSSLNNYAVNI